MRYESGAGPSSFDEDAILPGEQGTLWPVVGNGNFFFVSDPHNLKPSETAVTNSQKNQVSAAELYSTDDPGIGRDISRAQSFGAVAANGAVQKATS